jgi:hypothetical protein
MLNFKQANLIGQNTFHFEIGGLDFPSFKDLKSLVSDFFLANFKMNQKVIHSLKKV